MAKTRGLNAEQRERARAAIQTTQLVRRLQFFALSEPDPASGMVPDLSASQIKAIETLLNKTLPNVQAVQLTGDDDNGPVRIEASAAAAKLVAYLDQLAERHE
jgi:cytochrome c1